MAGKYTEFSLILFLNVFFFFMLSYAHTILELPELVSLLGPSLVWILFNGILLYLFAIPIGFSLTRVHWITFVFSLALGVPFAGLFVILQEPYPVFAGLLLAFVDALLVSIAEEVSFRGIIGTLTEHTFNMRVAMVFQAVFFTFVHFQFTLGFILGYMAFSLVAWWLYTWQNRNILYPIVFHTITNFWMYILFL